MRLEDGKEENYRLPSRDARRLASMDSSHVSAVEIFQRSVRSCGSYIRNETS
jgi:hypothetical protein